MRCGRGLVCCHEVTLTYEDPRPHSREILVHHKAPAGECVLEVCFHPDELPAACHAFGTPSAPPRMHADCSTRPAARSTQPVPFRPPATSASPGTGHGDAKVPPGTAMRTARMGRMRVR